MIYGHSEVDQFVYHYTRAETAHNSILKSSTLRLSSLAETNDPRESKAWAFNLWTGGKNDLGRYDFQAVSAWFSNALKTKTRLACFALDQAPLTGDHTQDILRRGLARSRMWAQYGDKHQGVCLVFDKARLIRAVKEHLAPRMCWVGDVGYKDHYFIRSTKPHEFMINIDELEELGPERYAYQHVMQYHDQLFFQKLSDWKDEVEWRVIAIGEDVGELYLPIDGALVGVIHGAAIDTDVSDRLIAMTEGQSVEHMGLVWRNGVPWYDIGATRWSASDRALLGWKPRSEA